MDVVALATIALALAIGFLLGLLVSATRAIRARAKRRAVAGMSSQFAHFWPEEIKRTPEDILAGRVRIHLGGMTYILPLLSRAEARRWRERADIRWAAFASEFEELRGNPGQLAVRVLQEADGLYELLLDYDRSSILPPLEEIEELASDAEILRAFLEVQSAIYPLVGTLVNQETTTPSSAEPSGSPQPTDGAPPSSTASPTSRSSRTPTRRKTASRARPAASSAR